MTAIERMRLSYNQERRVFRAAVTVQVRPIEQKPARDAPASGWKKQGKQCTPQEFEELKAWAVWFAKDRAARGIPPMGPSILDEEQRGT